MMMMASSPSSSSSAAAGKTGKAVAGTGTAADPVCLLDSDPSGDESSSSDDSDCRIVASGSGSFVGGENSVRGTAARRKRRQRPPPPGDGPTAAFRLYATSNDHRSGGNAWSASIAGGRAPFTSTLREMVGLDGHPDPHRSLRFMCIFNYLVDFDLLLSELPELLSLDRVGVWYGTATNAAGPDHFRAAMGSDRFAAVQVVPSDPPGSSANPLDVRVDYGVHHTKLFLVGYHSSASASDGGDGSGSGDTLRVVVHTSNLQGADFTNNAQSAYVQDFPLKAKFRDDDRDGQSRRTGEHCTSADCRALSSPFEDDLVRYLDSYRRATAARCVWPLGGGTAGTAGTNAGVGGAPPLQLTLTEVLRRYDFAAARAVLVPSVPGYHRLAGCPWGHLRLREAIRANTSVVDDGSFDDDDDENGGGGSGGDDGGTGRTGGSLLFQFSSLGSVSLRWLHELASSMDVRAVRRPLRRLPGGAQPSSSLLDRIKIVWPTHEEVRTAAAGYAAGGPIPGRVRNTDRPFLRRFYHRWSSSASSSSAVDPMRKKRYPGHCKTFLQLSNDGSEVEWCLLTSHNLSTAALGQIQNNRRMGEQCLFIRHFELGVLFTPSTLMGAVTTNGDSGLAGEQESSVANKKLKSDGGTSVAGDISQLKARMVPFRGVDADYGENDIILPLPFDVAPTRYSSQDVPWATDRHGGLPDVFGRVLG
jgi:tyrosyl-DNA phosphodiesterase-1